MKSLKVLLATVLLGQTFLFAQLTPEVTIEKLHTGAVVVNLIYPQKTFDGLIKNGRKEDALALDAKTKAEHKDLIEAFKYSFTFCRVFFVSSNDLGALANGDFTVLRDIDNKPATQMPPFYIFAEMGISPNRGMEGLLARFDNRDYISKPFPFFVKSFTFFHLKRKPKSDLVKEWDELLTAYHRRVSK